MEVVVNELSACGGYGDPVDAREGMRRLVEISRAVFRLGAERTLRTTSDFMGRELAEGYRVAQWLNDLAVDLEERRFFRVVATKSPFLEDLMAKAEDERDKILDFTFDGARALGLGMAYLWDVPAVSLDCDERFCVDALGVLFRSLGQSGVPLEEKVEVCSLSNLSHVRSRMAWIALRVQREVESGKDLYGRKETLLPNLLFCDGAVRQLSDLGGREPFFRQVCRHLFVLNEYVGDWRHGAFSMSGITWSEESKETLDHSEFGPLRKFRCPDGIERIFSRHTKPGGGNVRIYFLPIQEERQAYVGYIGPHLPTVTFRT